MFSLTAAQARRTTATVLSLFAGLLFISGPALAAAEPVFAPTSDKTAAHGELYRGTYTGLSMGTLVQAQLYAADEATAHKLVDLLETRLGDYETLFTVHRSGPLNEVNRRAGSWVDVDCRIAALVRTARELAHDSDRAFEPTIGALVNVWKIGFGGDRHPEAADIQAALKKVDYRRIEVDETPGRCRVRIGKDQSIDLGAIAKGWIGTELAKELVKAGATNGIIDLGGNVSLIGANPNGALWRAGVQNPAAERGTPMAVIEAAGVSVITSGAYERKIEDKKTGRKYGHILSAVTGEPVATDIASVTIVHADGALADGWCTALFAMGAERAVQLLAKRPDIAALVVSDDLKRVWVSRSLADRVKILDKSTTITVVGKE